MKGRMPHTLMQSVLRHAGLIAHDTEFNRRARAYAEETMQLARSAKAVKKTKERKQCNSKTR